MQNVRTLLRGLLCFSLLFAVLVGCRQAQATQLLLALGMSPGGTISYAGGNSPVVASGLVVTSFFTEFGDAKFPATLSVTGGLMTWSTGPIIGCEEGECAFSGGGSLVLTGGITGPGTSVPDGTTLLVASVTRGLWESEPDQWVVIFQPTAINAAVADYFGIVGFDQSPPVVNRGLEGLNFSSLSPGTVGFSGSVYSSATTIEGVSAPEPSCVTLLLLGALIIGLGMRCERSSEPHGTCR